MAKLTHPALDATIDVPDAAVPSLRRKGWQPHEESAGCADSSLLSWGAHLVATDQSSTVDSTIAPATPGDASEGTPSLTSQEG